MPPSENENSSDDSYAEEALAEARGKAQSTIAQATFEAAQAAEKRNVEIAEVLAAEAAVKALRRWWSPPCSISDETFPTSSR